MWIITHPHPDHSGALTEILKKPGSIEIKSILQSRFPESLRKLERSQKHASRLYSLIDSSGIKEINLDRPGLTIKIDGMHLKVLGVTNPEITANPYNNSSMVLRVWDKRKSVLSSAEKSFSLRLQHGNWTAITCKWPITDKPE